MITMLLKYLLILLVVYGLLILLAFLFQRKLVYFPQRLSPGHQFELVGENDREVNLTTEDGVTINALWFRHQPTEGVILFFHGNAGNLENWQYLKAEIFSYGYDLFVIDYRGYGKSEGHPTEQGLYADAKAAYQYLRKQDFSPEQIILYGRSLGSGPALELATQYEVAGLILEAPFTSLPTLGQHHYPFLLPSLFLQDKYRNLKKAQRVNKPVLIFHGRQDRVIPFSHGERISKVFPGKVTFVPVNGGVHNNLANFNVYHDHLQQYLRTLKQTSD